MGKEEVEESIPEELFEKKLLEMAATMRKGSRKFVWVGIFLGFIFGAINHLFIMAGSEVNGILAFTIFGGIYGFEWYRLAWAALVPVSVELYQ